MIYAATIDQHVFYVLHFTFSLTPMSKYKQLIVDCKRLQTLISSSKRKNSGSAGALPAPLSPKRRDNRSSQTSKRKKR